MMPLSGFNPVVKVWRVFLRVWARAFGYDVFISYKRSDAYERAVEIKKELEKRYLVFFDVDSIEAGRKYREEIANAFLRTRTMVVLLTEGALQPGSQVESEC